MSKLAIQFLNSKMDIKIYKKKTKKNICSSIYQGFTPWDNTKLSPFNNNNMHIGSTLFKEFSVKNLKVNYFLSSRGVGANIVDGITGFFG